MTAHNVSNHDCMTLLQGKEGRIPGRNNSSSHPHQGPRAGGHFLSYPQAHWAHSVELHQISGSSFGKPQKTTLSLLGVPVAAAPGSSYVGQLCLARLGPWAGVPACPLPDLGDQPCWSNSGGWFQGLLHLTLSVSNGCNTEQSWGPGELLSSEAWCSLWGSGSFSQPLLQLGRISDQLSTGSCCCSMQAHLKHRSNSPELSAFCQSWAESADRRDQLRYRHWYRQQPLRLGQKRVVFYHIPKGLWLGLPLPARKQAQGAQAMGHSSVMLGAGQTQSK